VAQTSTNRREGDTDVHHREDRRSRRAGVDIGPSKRQFKADITEQEPDQRVAWKAQGETKQAGVVTFHRLDDDHSRVMLQMDMEPTDWAEKAADATNLVDRRVQGDLERFKSFIESRGHETGAWRGEVK
jgi:uncharacterized membrane protein